MRFALAGLLLVSASPYTQVAQPAPAAVLNSARARLLSDAGRQPRYTCVQNITRRMYRASSREKRSCATVIAAFETRKYDLPLASWDRLRLEVAIADGREIHAWPGAPRFSDDEVRRFLGPGVFGTGDFGIFLGGIFGGSASVKSKGKRLQDGRTLFDYTYEVPAQASAYHAEAGPASVITAYGGSFALDPQTADIVELTVRTAELPDSTGMCQARSQIEYGRVNIHGREVLIPRETSLRVIDPDGKEGFNTISYSSCREYSSQSVLRFDSEGDGGENTGKATGEVNPAAHAKAVAPAPQPATPGAPLSPLPAGLEFDCRIVTPLDSDTAAAGSPVEAILRTPIHGKNQAILAPRGAPIQGRLVRFVDHASPFGYFEVGVRLESVEVNGAALPLYATLSPQAPPPAPAAEWFYDLDVSALPAPPPPNAGVFFFSQVHLQARQIDATWITTSSETGNQNQTQKQIAETEALKTFIVAMNDARQATDLLWKDQRKYGSHGSSLFEMFASLPDLQDVLGYRQKAIEAGKSAHTDVLNGLYPSWGDEFENKFIESMSLFVQGCEVKSELAGSAQGDLLRSQALSSEWIEWYAENRKAIEDAVNLRELNAEWTTAFGDADSANHLQ